MPVTFKPNTQEELAPETAVKLERARFPHYGRYLEEFVPGQVFQHPRGITVDRGMAKAFATTFMQGNPLYLNEEFAKAHGFSTTPLCPQMVFNLVLSLGVQNDSEKAIANLGYYNAQFLRPVYPGDTIRSLTKVVDRAERGAEKPGIATILTLGLNQRDEVVLQYKRKIMVAYRGERPVTIPAQNTNAAFPWQQDPSIELPAPTTSYPTTLTGATTYFEDFAVGDIIVHANGRTITDEHVNWTYGVGNTHPLHYDRIYSTSQKGAMSGEPIVYGGLVFAWLDGIASRDLSENCLWEMGFTEGYHTQPAFRNDTVAALSRVLDTTGGPAGLPASVVTVQFIGVKNITANDALQRYGEELFIKEGSKRKLGKEKISDKIFEIERQLLIKHRPVN
ncbi:MAG: MaoC family dehydratase [Gammaproteobacteria bacterium]|nr:MaoC family dehydratase [Gammaproteobacteria bacterium]MBT8151102.1 MaoC family dehydratase [Gammaproteobacteria bacterium]NND38809.1 acyl dehydratase [Pseudomonadales bacterium]NNL10136.1 acyl dehydratase [Pseudomonadales bacterium]NNM10423.1 acyl dehydratase [Pseudomonadales bacterium]